MRGFPNPRSGPRTVRLAVTRLLFVAAAVAFLAGKASADPPPLLSAWIVVLGLPGAGAISAVGVFHPGGPIHDKPAFAAMTAKGQVLDPARVLVASNSNFGAPVAHGREPEGSVLSIDPDRGLLVLAPDFARTGGQAADLDGRVQLLTANSAAFLNGVNTPGAVTADLPPVSNPLGISINNGFGRLWFANAPQGASGAGTLSIVDPGGQPLAGAPSRRSGGVFAGELTGRQPSQLMRGGLSTGAMATALLGMSPDGSKRAVFAVLTADGAVAQAHTERSVDGLAPPGTIAGLEAASGNRDAASWPMSLRAGMAFNWVPDRILYVADPIRNVIVALDLTDDGQVFKLAGARTLAAAGLAMPVDIAPAVPEAGNPMLASNSTLAAGSDLYVVNRGSGTITRLRQDGTVAAERRVEVEGRALGPAQLNGIAVSPDAQRLWITVTGPLPDHPDVSGGALLELPAFGPGRAASLEGGTALAGLIESGEALFRTRFTAAEGLGPAFNATSCIECHAVPVAGGVAPPGAGFVLRVGRLRDGQFDPLIGLGGPVARTYSVAAAPTRCAPAAGIPAAANVTSIRSASALFGLGWIELIADETIAASHFSRGHPNRVRDGDGHEHVGRFGWKADTATLEQFVADAFRNELGITSPAAPLDLAITAPDCSIAMRPEDDGSRVHAVTEYLRSLPPLPAPISTGSLGRVAFTEAGCAACHLPSLAAADGTPVPLFSDLLLHDMGPILADGVTQGEAAGAEWRTPPLWGLHARTRFLHDGRATNLTAAILAHDGEAAAVADGFRAMSDRQRGTLLAFLAAL